MENSNSVQFSHSLCNKSLRSQEIENLNSERRKISKNFREFNETTENFVENSLLDFKNQFRELMSPNNFKYLFKPFQNHSIYSSRRKLLEKSKSHRFIITRLLNPLSILGIILVFIIFSWVFFAPLLTQFTFNEIVVGDFTTAQYIPPNSEHLLGTSSIGRDVYGRMIWGARSSIFVSMLIVFTSVLLGVLLGLTSGYYGGFLDRIFMRLTDIILAFPGIIVIYLIATISNDNFFAIVITYGIFGFPTFSRLTRAEVLKLKNTEFIQAAKVGGASPWHIMIYHILPNCISPIIISASSSIGSTILGLAGLRFLGFGVFDYVDWGSDIGEARMRFYLAPWAAITPGFAIFLSVLGFMLLGDGLRDALDPRLVDRKK